MRSLKTLLITFAIILAASCSKIGKLEPMPNLSKAEFTESICGTWKLNAVGMHTEKAANETERVVAIDTLESAIESITYKQESDGYQITFIFEKIVPIENTVIIDGKKVSVPTPHSKYEMYSSEASFLPLGFEIDDSGKEVFKTLSIQEGLNIHEHSYSYPIQYFGRDMISHFEIEWFILQANHHYYEFIKE